MANKDGHRRFGNIRRLPSGRFQIRYPGPDGRLRTGSDTYARKPAADKALSLIEGQMHHGRLDRPAARQDQAPGTTRRSGSSSGRTCEPARSSCTSGCSPSTSARTWAVSLSARSRR